MKKTLEQLPVNFQRKYKSKCGCCPTIKTETINYELRVEPLQFRNRRGEMIRTYRIYYQPTSYYNFSKKPKVIGENTGRGLDWETAISNLLEELPSPSRE